MKFLALTLTLALTGCAHLSQKIESADGDKYSSSGTSIFSKQLVQAKGNLIVYPNSSGLEFTVGNSADQDSTALVPVLQAAIAAAIAAVQAAQPAPALPGPVQAPPFTPELIRPSNLLLQPLRFPNAGPR